MHKSQHKNKLKSNKKSSNKKYKKNKKSCNNFGKKRRQKKSKFGSSQEYGVGYTGQTSFPETFYAPYFGAKIPFQNPDSWWPPQYNPDQTDFLGMPAEQSNPPVVLQYPNQMLYTYK